MRMFRAWLAGSAVLCLLCGSSLTATAQDREAAVTPVSGTAVTETAIETDGRVVYEQNVDWSDPRLPAMLRVEANWGGYGSGVDTIMTVEMRLLLEDAEGSWSGSGRAIESVDDRYSYYELVGDGAYQGLHALLRVPPGKDVSGPWDEDYEGFIFKSDLPPIPDPIGPAGE